MKPQKRSLRALLGAAITIGLGACGLAPDVEGVPSGSSVDGHERTAGPAIVRGTALEASSGRPLAGVLIEGPENTRTHTDAEGRFVLRGLAVGMQGELRGSTEQGLSATNRLRPLKVGALEVVLFLR